MDSDVASIVRLNVGGKKFCTTIGTLTQREPQSMLSAMFSGHHTIPRDSEKGYVFVDRDGKHFRHILNWLRDGLVPPLNDYGYVELQREAEYYQLLGLIDGINTAVNRRKDDEGLESELTCTDIIKCIQSEKVGFRGVNLSGVDLSKLVVPGVNYQKAKDPRNKPASSDDPGWLYGYWEYGQSKRDQVRCMQCGKLCSGGITGLKKHLIGESTNRKIEKCPNTTPEIERELTNYNDNKKKKQPELKSAQEKFSSAPAEFETDHELFEGNTEGEDPVPGKRHKPAPAVSETRTSSGFSKAMCARVIAKMESILLTINEQRVLVFSSRTMASHIVGYPRMGPKRELKFALESFWDGKTTADDLVKVAADLRSSIWKQMQVAGIKFIPSNTFSFYDQVLDTTAMLGAVPARYNWNGGEIGFDTFFSMARGNASVPAMEMTKWFDTNYHFIVPELAPDTKFSYASHKAVNEYNEAKEFGISTVPVLVGPVSYLLLSKPAKGVEKNFPLVSLLTKILPIYKEVIGELKAAGASWIQFDEPTLVKDLDAHQLAAFTEAYAELESSLSGLNVLIETYFADVPAEAYKTLTSLRGVTAIGFDLIRGAKNLDLIKGGFPADKQLFAGVVDGRNIWANDLAASLETLQTLEGIVGKDKLVVSTSCSLLHTAVDLVNETKLDSEIKSWLAFAAQKIVEVNALAKALAGQKDEDFFSANAAAQASRKSSPRVTNEAVQKAAAALKGSDYRRATNVSSRLDFQQKKLNLPVLPTTTIGSFPQTIDLRRVRREYKAKKISVEEYVAAIKEEITKVVKLQQELDIDVLVHGEPERNDMVEYFGEQLSGFAFTVNGWVQSYGSRCVKPPIIYGDVSRPKPMTVFWSSFAQSLTSRPMKGMLTGPVTILNWSFVRNDQPRFETCYQIALAIKDEVEDLEKAGVTVIQIDEAALREGLPLRKSEEAFYLDWAVHSFRITNCGVQDTTQIHTHMCYSNFNDIIHSIIDMDADVITIENSRSDEKLLSVFREGVKYGAGIGPGVYDIHSPRIPSTEEIADRINKMLAVIETNILWVNPDCGLKTRKYPEVKPALSNMVEAAKLLRKELANVK